MVAAVGSEHVRTTVLLYPVKIGLLLPSSAVTVMLSWTLIPTFPPLGENENELALPANAVRGANPTNNNAATKTQRPVRRRISPPDTLAAVARPHVYCSGPGQKPLRPSDGCQAAADQALAPRRVTFPTGCSYTRSGTNAAYTLGCTS